MVQRLKQITYLRAFAAISIVLIHATSGYVNTVPLGVILNQFPRYGSPVFVMMSGFILYHIELKRPSRSYMEFFRHRFLKVFIPYAIWTILYSTFTMRNYFLGMETLDAIRIMKTYLMNIVTGTGYVHLYFILIMIQLYALFPFLKKWVERYTYTTLTTAAVISFTFQSLIYLHRLSIITLPSIGIGWATLFPGWLVFFCFGIYLKINLEQTMAFWKKRKLLCGLLWIGLFAAAILEGQVSPVNITLRPTISLYGVQTFFLFYLVFDNLKDRTSNTMDQLLEWVANNSFNIYLIHPLVLNILVLPLSWGGYGGLVALYISAVICTCLVIHVLNKVKAFIKGPFISAVKLGSKQA